IPLYRFAEAILIYAEAQNELGNSGVAVQYVNMIRARARNGTGAENRPGPVDYAGPLDQVSVRDAIFAERDLELAHEAKRWFDQVRRDSEDQGYWGNSLHDHDPNSWRMQVIQDYKKRWPVPQGEIDIDPNLLPNNAGY
ncbi:MAG TPA: RagB/SusD family nutrient uptake outer membrane protein, partial [Gemmatimonadales bacterium]|nr:RagB/SusD family nutrient uptake outer membrane protein [Gemmatimonadales bacterium]